MAARRVENSGDKVGRVRERENEEITSKRHLQNLKRESG